MPLIGGGIARSQLSQQRVDRRCGELAGVAETSGRARKLGCELLDHKSPLIRRWVVRLLGDPKVLAERLPVAMLFLRTPGGLSHHPDEAVLEEDVEAALTVGTAFLERVARVPGD